MVSVTDLRNGSTFEDSGQIFQVLTYEHIKMGRGSATIRVKVKNLRTGSTTEKTFISGARVSEAPLQKVKAQYLYQDSEGFYFMDNLTFEQSVLSRQKVGDQAKFLKDGMETTILLYEDEPLSLDLPSKMALKITETGPGVRGDSATNVYKDAILENDLKVKVPLFIKNGDAIIVDTRTGLYVERVKEK